MHFPQVLALDNSGNPHSWMKWKDVVTLKVKGGIAWEQGNGDFLVRGGIQRITGKRSGIEINSIIALKGKFNPREKVVLNNQNLFRRDLHTCGYCGKIFREEKLSRDHIIPVSRGGKDIWTNVVTACKPCNNRKDNCTPQEADMELMFVPYVPNFAESLILRGRNILDDQMDFLKAFLPKHSRLQNGLQFYD